MSTRYPFWQSVDSLRQLEATIIAAGFVGITIADLQAATGLSRRTIDRNLRALIELGCEITHDDAIGSTPRTWRLTGRTVFSGGERR